MQPLADACGLPVLAFDRPGFGRGRRAGWRQRAARRRKHWLRPPTEVLT